MDVGALAVQDDQRALDAIDKHLGLGRRLKVDRALGVELGEREVAQDRVVALPVQHRLHVVVLHRRPSAVSALRCSPAGSVPK